MLHWVVSHIRLVHRFAGNVRIDAFIAGAVVGRDDKVIGARAERICDVHRQSGVGKINQLSVIALRGPKVDFITAQVQQR